MKTTKLLIVISIAIFLSYNTSVFISSNLQAKETLSPEQEKEFTEALNYFEREGFKVLNSSRNVTMRHIEARLEYYKSSLLSEREELDKYN